MHQRSNLLALAMRTGKTVWRIGEICALGRGRGTPGIVAFHELPSGEVLQSVGRAQRHRQALLTL